MRAVAVLCVRNEGAFLLDWIAHHKAVGFDHFVICSNNCQDGTDALLDRLDAMGHVTHIRNDGPHDNGGIQFTGLKKANKTRAVHKADWLLPLDIDEFVNVQVGAHRLADLWAALPEAKAITLTWRLFGNAGVVRWEDRPPWEVFTKAAPQVMHWPWRASMFKTLYRNDGTYQKLGVHRPGQPHAAKLSAFPWFDGEGRRLPEVFKTSRVFSPFGQSNTALVQLNHYALGAMESFVLKAARGRAVHSSDLLGLDYWVERNFAIEEDRSLDALEERRSEIRASLRADPQLRDLHDQAASWRKAQFERLLSEEPYRALFGRLLITPPSHPLSPAAAQSLLSYAQRDAPNAEKLP